MYHAHKSMDAIFVYKNYIILKSCVVSIDILSSCTRTTLFSKLTGV